MNRSLWDLCVCVCVWVGGWVGVGVFPSVSDLDFMTQKLSSRDYDFLSALGHFHPWKTKQKQTKTQQQPHTQKEQNRSFT